MRRSHKLLVTGLVLAASALLIGWNTTASAPPALGVTQAKRDSDSLQGLSVSVRGSIQEASIVYNGTNPNLVDAFVLADGVESLLVQFGQVPPDNFGPKEVVVRGVLAHDESGAVVLRASSLQVGCSSKY